MFSLLHTKSDFSIGYGTASVEELVAKAAALGYRALALTDLESMAGQIRFHQQCRSEGINPVTGIELRPDNYHRNHMGRVVLLALDFRGYQSLCGIVNSKNEISGCPERPRSIFDLVNDKSNGIFALSDDPELIERLCGEGGRFHKSRLGLLLVRPDDKSMDHARIEAANKLGVAVVSDLDVVFLKKTDHPLHILQREGREKGLFHRGQKSISSLSRRSRGAFRRHSGSGYRIRKNCRGMYPRFD